MEILTNKIIKRLEELEKILQNPYIGEVLTYRYGSSIQPRIPAHRDYVSSLTPVWLQFTREHITDEHDGL